MNKNNKTTEVNNTDKKLHISGCSVCGLDKNIQSGIVLLGQVYMIYNDVVVE